MSSGEKESKKNHNAGEICFCKEEMNFFPRLRWLTIRFMNKLSSRVPVSALGYIVLLNPPLSTLVRPMILSCGAISREVESVTGQFGDSDVRLISLSVRQNLQTTQYKPESP